MAKGCKCDDCRPGRERRQEIRHGGVTEEVIPWKSPGKKKNTKKWCKGKEGVKHVWEVRKLYDWTDRITAEVCVTCGKHGKFFYTGY